MHLRDLFEYPLPVLKTDVDKLAFNISGISEGFINIKNTGGGILKGEIFSNTECITFSEKNFSGNKIKIKYEINTASFFAGDRIISEIVIISTGGEKVIPVILNVMSKPFVTEDKTQLFGINQFYAYAKSNPIEARRILGSGDFMLWLNVNGFEHMDILEEIINDPNKERAIDNFFVLSGIKKKSDIKVEKTSFEYKIKNKELIKAVVKIKKIGTGYINAKVYKSFDKPWLRLFCDKLTSRDFDGSLNGELYFEIDPTLVDRSIDVEEIVIESEKKITVKIRTVKIPKIKVRLDKQFYNFDDSGRILIDNFSGTNLIFEIRSNDSFVKFEGEKYFVNERAAIPFKVKLAAFTKNRLDFRRKPFISGEIGIKTNVGKEVFSFNKKIIAGSDFL